MNWFGYFFIKLCFARLGWTNYQISIGCCYINFSRTYYKTAHFDIFFLLFKQNILLIHSSYINKKKTDLLLYKEFSEMYHIYCGCQKDSLTPWEILPLEDHLTVYAIPIGSLFFFHVFQNSTLWVLLWFDVLSQP